MHLLLVDNRVKDVQTVKQSLLPGVDYVSPLFVLYLNPVTPLSCSSDCV